MPDSMNTARESDRAFDWDEPVRTEDSFALLPDGEYPFTVLKCERGEFPGSEKAIPCKVAIVTLRVDGGKLGTAILTERFFCTMRNAWKIDQFFVSIGLRQPGEEAPYPWTRAPGCSGHCRVGARKLEARNGYPERDVNQVARYIRPSSAPGATRAPAASSAPVAPVAPASPAFPQPSEPAQPEAPRGWTPGTW